MLVAQVSEPETDTGTVLGGGPDHLTENLGDVQSFNLLQWLLCGLASVYKCGVAGSSEGYLLLVVSL